MWMSILIVLLVFGLPLLAGWGAWVAQGQREQAAKDLADIAKAARRHEAN